MNRLKSLLVLTFLILASCSQQTVVSSRAPSARNLANEFQYINPEKVLFGIEYSFQDSEIVSEPGRMTMSTPHKAKKFEQMFNNFLILNGLQRSVSLIEDNTQKDFKPGYVFYMPGDGKYVINMEPVTIEFNTTPKTIFQITQSSEKIFEAATMAGLTPYVNPAAERSGMGHIHIGGRTLADSPFYKNPNLLRNILVFYHKHPSLLYGFAEAYDIGQGSNIETYHTKKRQEAFQKAIGEFDEWYAKALRGEEDITQGLKKLVMILAANTADDIRFFHHYRYINLEHLKRFILGEALPEMTGKITVEFRTFRPQKSANHAKANAQMLLDIMETLSVPDYLEPFEMISEEKFKTFWSAGKIKSDWEEVKKKIKHNDPLSDGMLQEAVDALESKKGEVVFSSDRMTAKVYHAYSKKTDKGKGYELRVQTADGKRPPDAFIFHRTYSFEPIEIEGQQFWTTYVNIDELRLYPGELTRKGVIKFKPFAPNNEVDCNQLMQVIAH